MADSPRLSQFGLAISNRIALIESPLHVRIERFCLVSFVRMIRSCRLAEFSNKLGVLG